ncbi:MAG: Crp/Fnr family transcriptional regulator, partial [Acidobacteria bacterium]|nr:Crp/Fnr family transcriptional regulator [Acidobacteriota bacterium]
MSSAQSVKKNGYSRSLGSLPLFSSLPHAGIRELETKLIFARHATGSILFRQGEKAKGIFLVFEGRVRVFANAIDERTALLKVAGPGAVLGLAAMLSENPDLTTAQATEPSVVARLWGDDLINSMQKYPQLLRAVAQFLAAECIETATEALLLRVPSSSFQRLATALLR